MGFDPQTEQRMQELFGGKQCCLCGRPARRLAHDRFYCDRHFLRGKRAPGPRAPAATVPQPSAAAGPAPATPGTDAAPPADDSCHVEYAARAPHLPPGAGVAG
jgi:hypothetical protein